MARDTENVRVLVRVRPLTTREERKGDEELVACGEEGERERRRREARGQGHGARDKLIERGREGGRQRGIEAARWRKTHRGRAPASCPSRRRC